MKKDLVIKGPANQLHVTLFPNFQTQTSKNHSQDDTNVVGISGRGLAFDTLLLLVDTMAPGKGGENDLICTATYPLYKKWIRESASAENFPVTLPHDFRHAGASMDGFCGQAASFVRGRGHWKSESSMIRYHEPGRYARGLSNLSLAQRHRANELMAGEFMYNFRRALNK